MIYPGEGTTEETQKEDGGEAQEAEGDDKPENDDTDGKPSREGGDEKKEDGQDDAAAAEEKPGSPIPQSDTFAEGERPETPVVAVTEPLSREGSPPPPADGEQMEPGTPERIGKILC